MENQVSIDTVARAAKKGAGDEETGSSGAASAPPRLSAAPIAAPAPKEGERKGPEHAHAHAYAQASEGEREQRKGGGEVPWGQMEAPSHVTSRLRTGEGCAPRAREGRRR